MRSAFPITTFYTTDGKPLSNGYLLISISDDVQTPDSGQLGSRSASKIDLDVDGSISGSPTFWDNASMLPNDTVYLLSAYAEQGQQVLDRIPVIVVSGGTLQGFGETFGTSFSS